MKKQRKGREADALRANTEALLAHARALDDNTQALNTHAKVLLETLASTGCCTISAPGVADQQYAGLTRKQCDARARQIDGGVAHWVEGSCA